MGKGKDFLSRLDPKIVKHVQMAKDVELIQYPLASIGVNRHLKGGIGAGRVTLLYGNSGSGKSLITMQSIGQWQKMGLVCAYFDIEGTYIEEYGARLGIDNDELIYVHKRGIGAVTDIATEMLENDLDVLVIDSISDLIADAFIDKDGNIKDFENTGQVGAHAKGITRMINMLQYANTKTAIVIVSQTTTEIGQTYTKQVPHGGKKVFFAATNVIKLTSSNTEATQIKGELTVGDRQVVMPIGRKVDVLIEKSKVGAQHRTASYNVYYDGENLGIDNVDELSKIAVDLGVTTSRGAWYYWGDEKWNGEAKFSAWLKENPEMQEKLRLEIEALS